jgi:hypothetical protein
MFIDLLFRIEIRVPQVSHLGHGNQSTGHRADAGVWMTRVSSASSSRIEMNFDFRTQRQPNGGSFLSGGNARRSLGSVT